MGLISRWLAATGIILFLPAISARAQAKPVEPKVIDLSIDSKVKASPQSIAVSPDGKLLVSGERWRRRRYPLGVFDIATAKQIDYEHEPDSTVRQRPSNDLKAVAFSPKGDLFATGGDRGIVQFWSPESRKCVHSTPHRSGEIWSVAFSSDGALLAASYADQDHSIALFDAKTFKEISHCATEHEIGARSLSFVGDGRSIASADWRGTKFYVWSVPELKLKATLDEHRHGVGAVAYSPDGKYLATASGDSTALIHDAQTLKVTHKLAIGSSMLAWSPDSKLLAVLDWSSQLEIYETKAFRSVYQLHANPQSYDPVEAERFFFVTSDKLATLHDDKLTIWDVSAAKR
jgi:WD40 repeat protein